MDPISTGQLTRDEIEKGEKDPNYRLKLGESKVALPPQGQEEGPRAIRRCRAAHERPSAILWLVRKPPRIEGRADPCGWSAPPRPRFASVAATAPHWNASTADADGTR